MIKYFDNKIVSNPGSPIHVIFNPIVNDDGTIDLIESGKENTDDIIQSYAESCDIQVIMRRVMEGETELLSMNQGIYGDFVDMPSTYAEMLQLQIDSRRLFDSLPLDVRSRFDNDANQFFAQAGTDDWLEKCGYTIPEDIKEKIIDKSEVKEGDKNG